MRVGHYVIASLVLVCGVPAVAQEAPPEGAAPNLTLPRHRADGQFMTPSDDVVGNEALWHLRSALNVAALGCADSALAANYNTMLERHAGPLRLANDSVSLHYRQLAGNGWADARDRAMTKLYNFFAQVPGHRGFCDVARHVLAEMKQVSPRELAHYAEVKLTELQAPFQDFYARYEAWRNHRLGGGQRDSIAVSAAVSPR